MKVALLNDLAVAGVLTPGEGSGAELSCGHFVREGHRRGHVVDGYRASYLGPGSLDEYDVVVTKNVTEFTRDQLGMVMREPYIAWPSDYCWSRWRLFFGFQEQHKALPAVEFWKRFFRGALCSVFLSPLHKKAYEFVMPEVESLDAIVSPPPADVGSMKPDPAGWVPNTACTINGGLEFKGLHANLTWAYEHPDVKFTFIGAIREQVDLPPNARFVGRLSWAELRRVLGQTETYVELPNTVQPYNQSCVNGFLACKRVETNRLMGCASYPWFKAGDRDKARAVLTSAMSDLWDQIEKRVAA